MTQATKEPGSRLKHYRRLALAALAVLLAGTSAYAKRGNQLVDKRASAKAPPRSPQRLPTSVTCRPGEVPIRYLDVRNANDTKDSTVKIECQRISTIKSSRGCEYRLEYDDPSNRPKWAVHEIAGDLGPRQRYFDRACGGASFVATKAANAQHFEEQTIYYWMMLARDYAMKRLWVTPEGWGGPPIKHSTRRVDGYLLGAGFARSCFPKPSEGCMRAFPTEGPRLYFKRGHVSPDLVGHEFGHYAAGYVFGHQDPVGLDGFDPMKCGKRSFQEAIAEMFMSSMLHFHRHDRYKGGSDGPKNSFHGNTAKVWDGKCGAGTDYTMGAPLVQAFRESLWNQSIWGSDHDRANKSMSAAFAHGLAKNRGHLIDVLAEDILTHLQEHQPSSRFDKIEAIFSKHGFKSVGARCSVNLQCSGLGTSRCDQTTKPYKCIPDDGAGNTNDYCTHNNQCRGKNCLNNKCSTAAALGKACGGNTGCKSGRCDGRTQRCIPNDGTGNTNNYCTHDNQCRYKTCRSNKCVEAKALGVSCSSGTDCRSGRCDRGAGNPRKCIPNDGKGSSGNYCTHNNQCRRGYACRLKSGKRYGTCRR